MENQIDQIVLRVDEENVTLQEFIKANVVDELQITVEELQVVLSLPVGGVTALGVCEVVRIK